MDAAAQKNEISVVEYTAEVSSKLNENYSRFSNAQALHNKKEIATKIAGARTILQFMKKFTGVVQKQAINTKGFLYDPANVLVTDDPTTATTWKSVLNSMSNADKDDYAKELSQISKATDVQELINKYAKPNEKSLLEYIENNLSTQLSFVSKETNATQSLLLRNQAKLGLLDDITTKTRDGELLTQITSLKSKLSTLKYTEKYLEISIKELRKLTAKYQLRAQSIPSISFESTVHIIPTIRAQNAEGNWEEIASPFSVPKDGKELENFAAKTKISQELITDVQTAFATIKQEVNDIEAPSKNDKIVPFNDQMSRLKSYEYVVNEAKKNVADLKITLKTQEATVRNLRYQGADHSTIQRKESDVASTKKELALAEAALEKAELQLDNETGGAINLRRLRGYTPGAVLRPLLAVETRRELSTNDYEREKSELRYASALQYVLYFLKVFAKLVLGVFGIFAIIALTVSLILSFVNSVIRGVLFDRSLPETDRLGIIVNYLDSEYPGIPKPTFSSGEIDKAIEFYTRVAVSTERARWGRTFTLVPFMDEVYKRFVFLPMAYYMLKQYMFLLPGPIGEFSDFLFFGIEWSWNLIIIMLMLQLLLFALNGITLQFTGIVSMLSSSIAPWISLILERVARMVFYSVAGFATMRAGACWMLAPTSVFFSGSSNACPRLNAFVPSSRAEIAERTLDFNVNHEAYCAAPQATLCSKFQPYSERHVLTQGDQKGRTLLITGKCTGSIVSCKIGSVISEIRN